MTTETINSSYRDGQRVATQLVTYDKSDDLYTLAGLQRRYENTCREIASYSAGEVIPEHLFVQKAELEAEIELQESYLDGYKAESEENA